MRREGVPLMMQRKKVHGEMQRDIDSECGLDKAAGRCTSNQDISAQAGSKLHSFRNEDGLVELKVEGMQERRSVAVCRESPLLTERDVT